MATSSIFHNFEYSGEAAKRFAKALIESDKESREWHRAHPNQFRFAEGYHEMDGDEFEEFMEEWNRAKATRKSRKPAGKVQDGQHQKILGAGRQGSRTA